MVRGRPNPNPAESGSQFVKKERKKDKPKVVDLKLTHKKL